MGAVWRGTRSSFEQEPAWPGPCAAHRASALLRLAPAPAPAPPRAPSFQPYPSPLFLSSPHPLLWLCPPSPRPRRGSHALPPPAPGPCARVGLRRQTFCLAGGDCRGRGGGGGGSRRGVTARRGALRKWEAAKGGRGRSDGRAAGRAGRCLKAGCCAAPRPRGHRCSSGRLLTSPEPRSQEADGGRGRI